MKMFYAGFIVDTVYFKIIHRNGIECVAKPEPWIQKPHRWVDARLYVGWRKHSLVIPGTV